MSPLVQSHRKVCFKAAEWPFPGYTFRLAIDDRDLFGAGDIHKDPRTSLLQLERFRMGIKFDGSHLLECERIDDGEPSLTVADINPFHLRIVTSVVCIIELPHCRLQVEGGAVQTFKN